MTNINTEPQPQPHHHQTQNLIIGNIHDISTSTLSFSKDITDDISTTLTSSSSINQFPNSKSVLISTTNATSQNPAVSSSNSLSLDYILNSNLKNDYEANRATDNHDVNHGDINGDVKVQEVECPSHPGTAAGRLNNENLGSTTGGSGTNNSGAELTLPTTPIQDQRKVVIEKRQSCEVCSTSGTKVHQRSREEEDYKYDTHVEIDGYSMFKVDQDDDGSMNHVDVGIADVEIEEGEIIDHEEPIGGVRSDFDEDYGIKYVAGSSFVAGSVGGVGEVNNNEEEEDVDMDLEQNDSFSAPSPLPHDGGNDILSSLNAVTTNQETVDTTLNSRQSPDSNTFQSPSDPITISLAIANFNNANHANTSSPSEPSKEAKAFENTTSTLSPFFLLNQQKDPKKIHAPTWHQIDKMLSTCIQVFVDKLQYCIPSSSSPNLDSPQDNNQKLLLKDFETLIKHVMILLYRRVDDMERLLGKDGAVAEVEEKVLREVERLVRKEYQIALGIFHAVPGAFGEVHNIADYFVDYVYSYSVALERCKLMETKLESIMKTFDMTPAELPLRVPPPPPSSSSTPPPSSTSSTLKRKHGKEYTSPPLTPSTNSSSSTSTSNRRRRYNSDYHYRPNYDDPQDAARFKRIRSERSLSRSRSSSSREAGRMDRSNDRRNPISDYKNPFCDYIDVGSRDVHSRGSTEFHHNNESRWSEESREDRPRYDLYDRDSGIIVHNYAYPSVHHGAQSMDREGRYFHPSERPASFSPPPHHGYYYRDNDKGYADDGFARRMNQSHLHEYPGANHYAQRRDHEFDSRMSAYDSRHEFRRIQPEQLRSEIMPRLQSSELEYSPGYGYGHEKWDRLQRMRSDGRYPR
ncbi:hypothetical protein HDU76_002201 [Blyttiomyces sp. JEL0837]|nr:hypothetical protein HDU76_002201 [Blyttiomyces sp. JEL0837]